MNTNEKDAFVQSIIKDLQHEILKRISKMPEEWDGHEIRQFIADYYNENFIIGTALQGKRKKDYKNFCLVNNLT